MTSKLPSGFKTRKEYNDYMRKYNRDYRERKRKETDDLIKAYRELQERRQKTQKELADFLVTFIELYHNKNLSCEEKLAQLADFPISPEVQALLIASFGVVTKEEEKQT
jgi:hypothetical protein